MAGINYEITGDNSNFLQKMQQVRSSMSQTTQNITKEGASIDNMFSKLAKSAAAFGAGFSAVSFAKQVAQTRGEFQKLEASFETLLGNKEKSDDMMRQMVELAATTPFDLKGVASGAKQLLAYGVASDEVTDTMRRLGDISAGLNIQLGDMAYLYGTTMVQGRLYTADFNQFVGRGIPLTKELAKQFGVAESEVKKLVEEGKVGFPEVQKALFAMTSEGGKFAGLMEKQSKTISGQIGALQDGIEQMFNEIGKQSEDVISGAIGVASDLVANYETVGKTIAEIAVAFGTIKAVYASYVAIQNLGIKQEIEGYERLLATTKDYGDEQVNQLARSGKINDEQAQKLAQLKAEARARMETLQIQARQTQLEHQSAIQANITAKQRVASAEATLNAERKKLAIAQASGSAEAIANAQRRVNTAETNLNTASQDLNNTQRNLSATATARQTAQTALNTAQAQANTIAVTASSRATQLFAMAQKGLANVMRMTGLSMLANPFLLATTAIVGAGYALYKFLTYETEAEKSTKRMNEALVEAQAKANLETDALEELIAGLDGAKKGTDEYKETKDQIVNQFAKYYDNLESEYDALMEQGKLYDLLAEKVNHYYTVKAAQQTMASESAEIEKRYVEAMQDLYDQRNDFGVEAGDYTKVSNAIKKGELTLSENGNLQGEKGLLQAAYRLGGSYVQEVLEAMTDRKNLSSKIQEIFDVTADELSKKEESKVEGTQVADNRLNKTETEKKIKEQQAYYKKLQELRQKNGKINISGKEELVTDSMLESEKKGIDNLIKSWEQMTGLKWDTSKAVKKDVDDIAKELERLTEAFNKQSQDNAKSSADNITNQYERAIAQAEAEYNVQKSALDKLAGEASALNKRRIASGQLSSADTTTDSSGNILTKDQQQVLLDSYRQLEDGKTKAYKEAVEARERYYLDITDKYALQRYDIEQKYTKMADDLKARRANASGAEEVAMIDNALAKIQGNQQNEMFKVNFEEFQGSELYQKAFGDLDSVGLGTLEQIQAKLKEMETQIPETMDPADIKAFQDAIKAVNDELISRNPLASWVDAMERIKEARKEQAEAKEELASGKDEERQAKQELKLAKNEEQRSKAITKLAKATNKQETAQKKLTKANDKEANAQDDANEARESANGLMEQANDVLQMVAENSSGVTKDIVTGIQTILNVGQFGMQAMEASAKVTARSVEAVEKASVILAIISAAMQLAMKVASLFSGKSSKEAYAESKEVYEAYIDVLDRVIDKQLELAESATASAGKSALQVAQEHYKEALQLVEESKEATRKIAVENLSARSNNAHSTGYRTFKENMTDEGYRQALEKLQEQGLSEWSDTKAFKKWINQGSRIFTEMSDEQISALSQSAEFMAHLDSDTRDYILSITESATQLKDIQQQAIEQTVGYSFDEMYDDWKDVLSDMSGEGDTFAQTFSEKLKNAIIEAELQRTFKSQLDALTKKQNQLMQGQGSDITPAEYESLMADAREIDKQIEEKRNELKEKYGFEDETTEEQEATFGGFETMSEETGTELSGRFSAMQIIQTEQLAVQRQGVETLTNISNLLSSSSAVFADLRDMQILAVNHLSDMLSLHKKTFEEWSQRIENIEKYTKNLE